MALVLVTFMFNADAQTWVKYIIRSGIEVEKGIYNTYKLQYLYWRLSIICCLSSFWLRSFSLSPCHISLTKHNQQEVCDRGVGTRCSWYPSLCLFPTPPSQFISLVSFFVVRAQFDDNKLVVEYTRFIRLSAHHRLIIISCISTPFDISRDSIEASPCVIVTVCQFPSEKSSGLHIR